MGASQVQQACQAEPCIGAGAEVVQLVEETSHGSREKTKAKQAGRTLNRNSVRRKSSQDVGKLGGSQVMSSQSFTSSTGFLTSSTGFLSPRANGRKSTGGRRPSMASPRRSACSLDPAIGYPHRIVVIGDLHGMVHKAKDLWRTLDTFLGQPALLGALVVFLGDYVDRGPYTKELVSWLISIKRQRDRQGARTIFLCGNHEFCLLGFLGLLPRPEDDPNFIFSDTWGLSAQVLRSEKDRLWDGDGGEKADNLQDVHIQGRRWAGSAYEKSYGSCATFSSYGANMADREGLRHAMPEEHVEFFVSCPWVHIEENPLLGRLVFAHAGLESDGSDDCEAQIQRLKRRDPRHPQPVPLFGRDEVLQTPPQLSRRGITVVSGHHGRVMMRTNRIILDSCCGYESNPLMGLILPEMLLVHHDGTIEQRPASGVFGCHWRDVQARAVAAAQARKPPPDQTKPVSTAPATDCAKATPATTLLETGSGAKGQKQPCSPRKTAPLSPKQQRSHGSLKGKPQRSSLTTSPTGSGKPSPRRVGLARKAVDERFTLPSTLEGLTRTACQERLRPPGDSSPLAE